MNAEREFTKEENYKNVCLYSNNTIYLKINKQFYKMAAEN